MKLICIQRDIVGYLKVGEVYTKIDSRVSTCGCRLYYQVAEIPPEPRRARFMKEVCRTCGWRGPTKRASPREPVWFQSRRFAPWRPDELGITEEAVRELYAPKLPEKV